MILATPPPTLDSRQNLAQSALFLDYPAPRTDGTPAFLHQFVQLVQDLEHLLVLGIGLFISNA
jgi:hypothetical protein